MGKICIEYSPGSKYIGTVYNKPYVPQAGIARRALGRFFVSGHWHIKRKDERVTPMVSVRVQFDTGESAIGRAVDTGDLCLEVYERLPATPGTDPDPRRPVSRVNSGAR